VVTNPSVPVNLKESSYVPNNLITGKDLQYQSPVMISERASIGNHVKLVNSVIAGKCTIGNNVIIENSFIGEDVIIENDCVIKNNYLWNQLVPKNTYLDGNE
jgi:translation initiation factor eIF-2B subunit epsilon